MNAELLPNSGNVQSAVNGKNPTPKEKRGRLLGSPTEAVSHRAVPKHLAAASAPPQLSKMRRTAPSGSFSMRQRLSNTMVWHLSGSLGVQARPG